MSDSLLRLTYQHRYGKAHPARQG